MRILTLDEDLEEKRKTLSTILNRPVYIASCLTKFGTLYKEPDELLYRSRGNLELYLSNWSDQGKCVLRSKNEFHDYDDYYYDLIPSEHVYLVFPTDKRDKIENSGLKTFDFCNVFNQVQIQANINPIDKILLEANEFVVPELVEWMHEGKSAALKKETRIKWILSEPILFPKYTIQKWTTYLYRDSNVSVLKPPGKYAYEEYKTLVAENWNRILISERDPGDCIVCRGKSGKRKHLAQVALGQSKAYPTNLICSICFKEASKEWQLLLEE